MDNKQHYDFVVIGAGQAGDPLGRALAQAGRKTALIERDAVGGTCVNYGCTPTKTMVASGRAAYVTRRGPLFGVHSSPPALDMVRVRQRKRDIVESFRSGTEKHLRQIDNLDLIYGSARFIDNHAVAITGGDGDRTLTADAIAINTGCRSTIPTLPGLADVPFLDSTSIMELDAVPEHLVILGGGYIGVEFGQLFRRLGSRVTIIQRSGRLLGREDEDVAEAVSDILREDGIELLFNSSATDVSRSGAGVRLTIEAAGADSVVEGSHLLVAVGRTPNTETLGAENAGIDLDNHGFIVSDSRLQTTAPGIYVVGDVKGGPAFTHISYDDYRVLKRRLLGGEDATIEGRQLPYTVFMDPQLGRIGMTEGQARASGANVKVAKLPMDYVARALEMDETRGFVKAIVDADTAQILGASVLGYEGGELMAIVQVAMLGKLPYAALRDGIFAHPTSAELFNNLFADI